MKFRRFKSGFTLIEMLAVIAIIGILGGLLIPALSRAKDGASATSCRNNLRQLGVALNLYVGNNEIFPTAKSDVDRLYWNQWKVALSEFVARGPELMDASGRYMDSPTFKCPSRKGTRVKIPDGIPNAGQSFAELNTSYGYNGYGSDDWDGRRDRGLFGALAQTGFVPTREAQVASPSNMICIGDGFMRVGNKVQHGTEVLLRGDNWVMGPADPAMEDAAKKRHNERANFVFADGHCEFLANKLVFLDNRPATLARWNKDNNPHL